QIYIHLGEFDRTLQYLNRSLSINEDLKNLLGSAATYHLLSRVLLIKGQLNQASDYLTQATEIYQQLESVSGLCSTYETQGLILYQRGDYKKATEYLTKSIEHCKNKRNKKELVNVYFWLIVLTVESNLLEEAQKYLKKMQKALEKQSNQISNMEFKMASAFILKKSTNQDILSKAKVIFKDIINNETIDVNLTSLALYNISELILKEVQISRNLEDLKQIDPYIEKHLELAKQLGSHLMIADNFWLKANISLLQTDVSKAVILLEQAEQITDEKALRRLGIKIARGLDILSDHKEETKSLTAQQETAVSSEIAKVNSEVVRMIDRKTVDIPKLQDEEPVLLIIVFEGGVTVFSKKFSQKEMIDEMFVGGFLTAIDAFMHQTFATGGSIERIQHQEYTLLLKVENPLLFCYVFKGQSFTAIQKLDNIVQELKKSSTIWHALSNNLGEQLNETEKALIGELADQVFLADQ
ncbi:MAG: tetratricopeptide repeat protein, partial [Candidatus Heimdallarchaeota archaeon]